MDGITVVDWAVIFGGIGGIVWVNWYFFVAGRTRRRPEEER